MREADEILKACKEKGMAFVVDRELPKTNPYEDKMRSRLTVPSAILVGQQDMLKAGYKLIEEIDIED